MKYHLVALLTVFLWGLTFVSTKVLLADLSPLWILLLRFLLGTIVLCLIRPRILKLKQRRDELLFVAAGATGVAAYYLLENIALVYVTATAVGVIVATAPLFTALISAALGDRSFLNGRFFAGFALAIAGLVTVGISTGNDGDALGVLQGSSALGALLAILAGLVWAVYSILVSRLSEKGYETIATTKRSFLWGILFIAIAVLLLDGQPPVFQELLKPEDLLNLLFLGVVASAACFVTWGVAVKHLGATTSTTYIYLAPAITASASIIILGEPLNAGIVLGIAMTVGGLLLSQKRRVSLGR